MALSLRAYRSGAVGFPSTGIRSPILEFTNVIVTPGNVDQVETLDRPCRSGQTIVLVDDNSSDPGTIELTDITQIDGVDYFTTVTYTAPSGSTANFKVVEFYWEQIPVV